MQILFWNRKAQCEKLKFISFDDTQTKFKKIDGNENYVTNSKYADRINDIKNDKIKKSLLELTKLFKQRWKKHFQYYLLCLLALPAT